MRVLVISSRDLEKGSTKYRIAQYEDFLKTRGVEVDYVRRKEINSAFIGSLVDYDLVFNQKCLFRCSLAKRIIRSGRRTLFDFDDAIYTRPGKPHSLLTSLRVRRRLHLWLREADVVTTANEYLARYARAHSSAVVVIPMAIDMNRWKPRERAATEQLTIGWAGAPVNLRNIERIEPVLSTLTERYPFLKLAIFSGRRPQLRCPYEYHPFSPGEEVGFVQKLDIGLLPLPSEEYSKGKSPIKAIQYLACGVPVVGNVLGATAEILNETNSIAVQTQGEWLESLESLINDRARLRSMGKCGRDFVVQRHNLGTVAEQLFNVLSNGYNAPAHQPT